MISGSSGGPTAPSAPTSQRRVPKAEFTHDVQQTQPANPPVARLVVKAKEETAQPPINVTTEENHLAFPSHPTQQDLLSPPPSDFSESPSVEGGERPRAIWPGGPTPSIPRVRRASSPYPLPGPFRRVLGAPGPPPESPQGASRQTLYGSRTADRRPTSIAWSASPPSWTWRVERQEDDQRTGIGGPFFIKEGIDMLQQRVDSLATAFRLGALSILSTAKWVLLLGLTGFVFLIFLLCCLSSAAGVSYYLLSVYSTPPPLHEFPVYFNYFPRVAIVLSGLEKGPPAFHNGPHKEPSEESSAFGKGAPKEETPSLESNPLEGPPLAGQAVHHGPSAPEPSAWPLPSHLAGPQLKGLAAYGGGAPSGAASLASVGFSLSSLEDPLAVATIPFSNRSWELVPGDTDMFAAPDIYLSSHWMQQHQQHPQHPAVRGASPVEREDAKLPLFNVDLILSVSLPTNSEKTIRDANMPPVMLSLFLYSDGGSIVARSSRPLPPPSCASSLFSLFLPSLFCIHRTDASIYLMEHFPLSLIPHLKYARMYLYPPVPFLSATLFIQPKPEGLRLLVIQHPYISYLILTLFLLVAAAATICCCCCCCCGYLLSLAAPPEDEPANQGPPLQAEGPAQRDPTKAGPHGGSTLKAEGGSNWGGGPTAQQNEEERGAGGRGLRRRITGRRQGNGDS